MSLKSRIAEIAHYPLDFSQFSADTDLPEFLYDLHIRAYPDLDSEAKIIASMAFQGRFVTQLLKYLVKNHFTNDRTIEFLNRQIDRMWEQIYWEETEKCQEGYDKRKDALRQKQIKEQLNKEFGITENADSKKMETLAKLASDISIAATKITDLVKEE